MSGRRIQRDRKGGYRLRLPQEERALLATLPAQLREVMQTDVFYWHGYAVLLLDGAWRKATPAFNRELCERFDLLPLEFDGRNDSLYHPFDRQGHRHMEYLSDRGAFDDVPLARMTDDFARLYPRWAPRHAEMAIQELVLEAPRIKTASTPGTKEAAAATSFFTAGAT